MLQRTTILRQKTEKCRFEVSSVISIEKEKKTTEIENNEKRYPINDWDRQAIVN